MREDVLAALGGRFPERVPSREAVAHPGLIREIAGTDPLPAAMDKVWEDLEIDIHPDRPAALDCERSHPNPTPWTGDVYAYTPAAERLPDYARAARQFAGRYGDRAVHYNLYYQTLVTRAVLALGWEPFLAAAAEDPARFDRHFWEPWTVLSRRHCAALAATVDPVVFVHDHLATARGTIFAPAWYDRWIFPRYRDIWEPLVAAGKLVVLVVDGCVDVLLERLLELPLAGLMVDIPATSWERVLAIWGAAGRGFIGGIDTRLLTLADPAAVARHTHGVFAAGRRHPGFVVGASGGLPANIPPANLHAYLATRRQCR